jgi:protein-S-isoprenylcysteine O-methyltransferase Ste14
MRGVLIAMAAAFMLATALPARTQAAAASGSAAISSGVPTASVFAQQVPDKTIDVNVNTGHGGGRWYANPVWIGLGVLAVIVILLLVVLAARGGGGTTIVKE